MGRVSFTADIWSDPNRRPFLGMTAHWIGKIEGTTSLQLKASLIAFHRLHGNHDRESLASTVLSYQGTIRIPLNGNNSDCSKDWSFYLR